MIRAVRYLYTRERSRDTGQCSDFELRSLDEISRVTTEKIELKYIFQTSKGKIRSMNEGMGEFKSKKVKKETQLFKKETNNTKYSG